MSRPLPLPRIYPDRDHGWHVIRLADGRLFHERGAAQASEFPSRESAVRRIASRKPAMDGAAVMRCVSAGTEGATVLHCHDGVYHVVAA